MARGGRNWFPNVCVEFHQLFLPCFKGWMIWSTEKIGIRGRLFLPIIILLQDSKDIFATTSALERRPKRNYFSSSLTPCCTSWYFWMGSLRAPGILIYPEENRCPGLSDGKETKLQCSKVETVIQSKENWRAVFVNGTDSLSGEKKYLPYSLLK